MRVADFQNDYNALIFDLDGTLVDSHPVAYAAWRLACAEVGAALDAAWYAGHAGLSPPDFAAALVHLHGLPISAATLVAASQRHYATTLHTVQPVPWVVDIARSAHGQLPTAVASGGLAVNVLATMRTCNLSGLFDVVVTRDDVEHGKPAPDIFLSAAARMEVPPRGCLVFEDSDEGLAAAYAAGMAVVDVRDVQ